MLDGLREVSGFGGILLLLLLLLLSACSACGGTIPARTLTVAAADVGWFGAPV